MLSGRSHRKTVRLSGSLIVYRQIHRRRYRNMTLPLPIVFSQRQRIGSSSSSLISRLNFQLFHCTSSQVTAAGSRHEFASAAVMVARYPRGRHLPVFNHHIPLCACRITMFAPATQACLRGCPGYVVERHLKTIET